MEIAAPPAKRPKQDSILFKENISIRPVLTEEYKQEITLIKVHSCQLETKQQLQAVILELSQKLPHFQHLKRVNDRNVLICPTKDVEDNLEKHLQRHAFSESVLAALCKDVKIVEVPANMAKLRVQYEQMIKYWPCKYHPDKYAESLQNGTNFTPQQRIYHQRIAHLIRALAKDLNSGRPMGICVDPRKPSIVAIAGSNGIFNSHEHCSMLLVDLVARSQYGGALQLQLDFTDDIDTEPKLTLRGIPKAYYEYIKSSEVFKDLKCGAEVTQRSNQQQDVTDPTADNLTKYGPYLCTGYDVYLLREPCLICAMALLHSRVKRIFFVQPSDNGALFTRFQLHAVKELNHHYEVFQFITDT